MISFQNLFSSFSDSLTLSRFLPCKALDLGVGRRFLSAWYTHPNDTRVSKRSFGYSGTRAYLRTVYFLGSWQILRSGVGVSCDFVRNALGSSKAFSPLLFPLGVFVVLDIRDF